jgi:hypothetical protein
VRSLKLSAHSRNAMDNASKNAKDMIDRLTMQYNRGRQAAITNELVDIITGTLDFLMHMHSLTMIVQVLAHCRKYRGCLIDTKSLPPTVTLTWIYIFSEIVCDRIQESNITNHGFTETKI